jgi:flagellar protein FlbD
MKAAAARAKQIQIFGSSKMIRLTRLDRTDILLNPDLIEHVELTTDTVVTLSNGRSFVVRESAEEIQDRIIEFKRRCFQNTVSVIKDPAL